MPTLSDRSIIVTGAGSGIGRQIALQAARDGAHIIVSDLNETAAQETCDLIAQAAPGSEPACTVVTGDVSSPEVVEKIVAAATAASTLRGLANNAGVMDLFAGVTETDDATWERCLRINVTAPFLLMRAVIPHMLEAGGGSIVNTGSEAGLRGAAAGAAYTTSKHALVGLTRSTAYQYARQNVRVNTVMPGGVDTNIMDSIDTAKINQAGMAATQMVHQTAIRGASADEIAALIVFLLADEASNVSGAIIPCDAGWSAG